MAKGIKVKAQDIEPLIAKHHGNITAVARALGVGRNAVYDRIKASATLRAAMEDARASIDDTVESVYIKKVLEGSTPELLHFVKTRLRHRGYGENVEVTATVGTVDLSEWKRGTAARLAQAEQALALLGDGANDSDGDETDPAQGGE